MSASRVAGDGGRVRAEEELRAGRLKEALAQLEAQVRDDPANAGLRVFLFQLLAITAQWHRALTQLNVLRELDAESLAMVHAYGDTLRCEALREEIFSGKRSPVVFGEPEPWIARMMEALQREADGSFPEARRLREEALESAEPSRGSIDGREFEWIADADQRLGPVLEAVVNGRYYWVPFRRIRRIRLEAPSDLRDLVWLPVQFTWANGGETVGFVPSRYPGAAPDDDGALLLSRRTEWESPAPELFHGIGQRMLVTDQDEHPLLEVREIELANEDLDPEPGGG